MFVVHTSNCHGHNCTRRAIFRLGIDTLIANILVSFYITSDGAYVAIRREIGRNLGGSPLIFVRGHFQEIGIAALLFQVKPRHMEKFRKCRFADVGKSELGKK